MSSDRPVWRSQFERLTDRSWPKTEPRDFGVSKCFDLIADLIVDDILAGRALVPILQVLTH
jgi:hypothetical protein